LSGTGWLPAQLGQGGLSSRHHDNSPPQPTRDGNRAAPDPEFPLYAWIGVNGEEEELSWIFSSIKSSIR